MMKQAETHGPGRGATGGAQEWKRALPARTENLQIEFPQDYDSERSIARVVFFPLEQRGRVMNATMLHGANE